ncbi:MAG: HDOD domain-containing protein [Rhodocyclaceae bacterium]|nr:HDOD domain-containing protein [Rhodocyclaceae bacterium]
MAESTRSIESGEEELSALLKSVSIPPCPAVVSSLMSEIRREDADFVRIGRLLGADVGLAAAVMKVANSPFFGLQRKVSSVQQAVSVLGLRNIASIVTGLALQQALKPPGVSMERFWERSSLHAAICSRMAKRLPGVGQDDAYTFGLFHDCGIPILMQRFPDYKATLAKANESTSPMVDVEFEAHATSHVVVGALLARTWQLPQLVVEAIKVHHDPDAVRGTLPDLPEPVRALVCVSVLAEKLAADFLGFPSESEWEVLREPACAWLGLGEDEVEDLRNEIADDLSELTALRK